MNNRSPLAIPFTILQHSVPSITTVATSALLGALLMALVPTARPETPQSLRAESRDQGRIHPADQNADHQVSRDEVSDFARRRFAKLDKDNNGYLNSTDWAGHRRQCPKKRQLLQRMDRDQDGQITPQEMVALVLERHQKIDGDGDGQTSAKERRQHHQARHQQRSDNLFDAADSNGDGQLSARRNEPCDEATAPTPLARRRTRPNQAAQLAARPAPAFGDH